MMFQGEENSVDIITTSYCFICGKGYDSRRAGGGGGGVEGNGWSDMRTLLRLLCKLMSVPGWKKKHDGVNLSGQVEEGDEEEGTWDYSSSQTCGDCYSVLVQMEQLHALLERTRSSLEHHVRQVESLVVKSGAENVSCQSWTTPFRTFREQVIEAAIRTPRFEAVPVIPPPPPIVKVEETPTVVQNWDEENNYSPEPPNNITGWEPSDPLGSSPEEQSPPPPAPGPSSSTAPQQSNLEKFVKTESPILLETNHSKIQADSMRRRSPRNHAAVTPCFVRLEKIQPPPPIMTSTPPRRSKEGGHKRSASGGPRDQPRKISSKMCKLSKGRSARRQTDDDDESDWDPADWDEDAVADTTNDDNDTRSNGGSDYAPSLKSDNEEDDDNEESGSESEEEFEPAGRKSKKNSKKKKSPSTPAIKPTQNKLSSPFIPFIIADASKELYLFRQGTFVSKTSSHLVCHAVGCSFRVELSYYTAFQEMRAHILQLHGSQHHRQKFEHPCLLCNSSFPNQLTFRAHLPHHHTHLLDEHSTGVCESCLKPLRPRPGVSLQSWRAHMATHKSREETEEEEVKVAAQAAPSEGTPWRRSSKKKRVPTWKSRASREAKHKCTHEGCSYASKCPKNFRRHLNSHLPFAERPDVTACAQCGAHVLKESMKQHVIRRHNPELADTILMCPYCSKTYFTWENSTYQSHLLTHQGVLPYPCSECDAAFPTRPRLFHHVKRVHERPAEPPTPIQCDHCDKTYTKMGTYYKHLKKKHSDVVCRRRRQWSQRSRLSPLGDEEHDDGGGGGEKGPTTTMRWPCSFCELICSTKTALQGHLEEKHGVPPVNRKKPEEEVDKTKCTWEGCTYTSSCSRNLRRHMQSHLPRERRTDLATCDQCGASVLADSLKQHVLRMHNPELAETILQCGYCDKKYFTWENSYYQAHLLGHQEGVKPFMCSQCGAGFVSKGGLATHVRGIHGPPPETPLKCDHCDKTFNKRVTLDTHVRRRHAGLVPLRRFRNKVTKLNAMGTEEEEDGGEKRPIYGPIQRWPCPRCDVICSVKCALKRHMSTKHGGDDDGNIGVQKGSGFRV